MGADTILWACISSMRQTDTCSITDLSPPLVSLNKAPAAPEVRSLRQIFYPQTIVVLASLAAAQHGLRDFLERQIGERIGLYAKGPTANEECAFAWSHT